MSDEFTHNTSINTSDERMQGATTLAKINFTPIYLALVLGLLTPILLLASFNYVSDHFSVFHDDRNFQKSTNLNFVRMKYLLENDNQHRVILFGSSRVNALDMRSHISQSAYTFSTIGGVTYYHYLSLRTLIESGVVPDAVFLGLGEDAINLAPEPLAKQPRESRLHPRIESIPLLLYFMDYLAFIPEKSDFLNFKNRVSIGSMGDAGIDQLSLEFLATGRFYCYECEKRALERTEEEHKTFMANATRGLHNYNTSDGAEYGVSDAIDVVKMIIDLTDANNISLFIFIDPIYQEKYLEDDMERWKSFKRELSRISPFLDFSNFNSVFAEPNNFIDPVHYNRAIGTRLTSDIASVLEGKLEDIELGTWVTPENVDNYLQQQHALYLKLRQPVSRSQ